MSRHGWYFTIVSASDTSIEYAVICIDDEFDGYIHRMRADAMFNMSNFQECAAEARRRAEEEETNV
jgi:hypothetical protein